MSIEALEKKIKDVETKETFYRKYAEYHARKKEQSNNERAFNKQKQREEFYRMKQTQMDLEVQRLRGELALLELEAKKRIYHTELVGFYRAVIEAATNIREELQKFMRKEPADVEGVMNYYLQVLDQSGSFDKEDLKIFTEYLPAQSLSIRLSRIEEERSEEMSISLTRGLPIAAEKRTHIEKWGTQIIGQLDSLIGELRKVTG